MHSLSALLDSDSVATFPTQWVVVVGNGYPDVSAAVIIECVNNCMWLSVVQDSFL